jgi:hypothetical protein
MGPDFMGVTPVTYSNSPQSSKKKKGVVVFPGTWSWSASFRGEVDRRLSFEFLLSRKK